MVSSRQILIWSDGVAMKVCILLSQFYPIVGGAEKQAQQLAEGLIKHGVDVRVVTGRLDDDSKYFEYVNNIPVYRHYCFGIKKRNGKRVRGIGGPYLPFYWASLLALLIKIRNEYDIIHVFLGLETAVIAGLIGKIFHKKIILRLPCSGEFSTIVEFKKQYSILASPMLKIIRRADMAININSLIRRELIENGFPPENIVAIPNGVNTNYFQPVRTNSEKDAKKRELGLPLKKIVLFIGRLAPQKDPYTLLRAWPEVIKSYPNAYLVLLGDGPLGEQLKTYALDIGISDSVTFQGRVENPRDYFVASDVFVLPSKAEGMSNSLLEAIASGLPVIASSVAGNIDVITHCQNGLLFNVRDYAELSTAIICILKDDRLSSRLSYAARQTAVEKYSFDKVIQRHQMLYRELLM